MSNTDHLLYGINYRSDSQEPINFVETRFFDLSPFSAHEIEIEGSVFKTVEHAYQALRIKPGLERDSIKDQSSPMNAWREGQKFKNNPDLVVAGHDKYVLMEKLFRAKLKQHDDVRRVLLETGDRTLLKVYDTDYYWGTGKDNSGENKMGTLWMKLRDELHPNSNESITKS